MSRAEYMRKYREQRRLRTEQDDNELLPGPVYSTVEDPQRVFKRNELKEIHTILGELAKELPPIETAIDVHIPVEDPEVEVLRSELVEANRRIVELEEEVAMLKRPSRKMPKSRKLDFDFNDWLKELHPQDREFFEQRLK